MLKGNHIIDNKNNHSFNSHNINNKYTYIK